MVKYVGINSEIESIEFFSLSAEPVLNNRKKATG